MNDPETSDQKPGNPQPEVPEEFTKAIQAFAEATEAGKTEEAAQAAMKALMVASLEAMNHPTPELLLGEEASNCEMAGDWGGAESAYLKLLKLRETSGNFAAITKPLMDLSRLYRHTGNLEASWKYARAATAAARKTELYPLKVMALENEVSVALQKNDLAAALAAATEAVQVIEPGKMGDMMRGRAMAMHAECLARTHDLAAAEDRLQEAWKIVSAASKPGSLPGPVLALAKWWETKALIDTDKGALESAIQALTCAIELRRVGMQRAVQPTPFAPAVLATSLETLSSLFAQLGNEAKARQALEEANGYRKLSHLPPLPIRTPGL